MGSRYVVSQLVHLTIFIGATQGGSRICRANTLCGFMFTSLVSLYKQTI